METNELRELQMKVHSLCMDVQGAGHDVMYEYMGHVDKWSIRIYKDGWEPDMGYTYRIEYKNTVEDISKSINTLREIQEVLAGQ